MNTSGRTRRCWASRKNGTKPMAGRSLPTVTFETGFVLQVRFPWGHEIREREDLIVIGRLDGETPFFLAHSFMPQWASPVELGQALRSKILRAAKALKATPPDWLKSYRVEDFPTEEASLAFVERFVTETWRGQYLDDRDEDYIVLTVSFADKDKAKALGAVWDLTLKTWKVHKSKDLTQFARWMP